MSKKTSERGRHKLLDALRSALHPAGKGERGSALLVSLMIMVGLTLLGLGFVAVSQTESAISITERNYTQTLQVAEAATLRVVDWFQNPEWAEDQTLLPENRNEYKVARILTTPPDSDCRPAVGGLRYKSGTGELLFDKPFRVNRCNDRFFGTETNPDVWINETTSEAVQAATGAPNDFLTHFNILLFNNDTTATTMDNHEGGVVTDIRVYAPPVENGTLNTQAGWTAAASGAATDATGFIEGGTRFGIATVRVTATKYEPPCTVFPCTAADRRVIATRTVKVTIAEWPFPGPQGPVQTNANLNTSGNIQVHWGKTTANGDMTMAKTYAGIPWADAWDQVHWEHGYDNTTFPLGVTSTWPHAVTADDKDTKNYRNELVGLAYPDPWWQMRARGSLGIKGNVDPTPYSYTYSVTDPDDSTSNRSNWFQLQNQNLRPEQQNVLFPRIDYSFWKQLAITADDEPNIYYLRWVAADTFQDKYGNQRTFRQWVDITSNPPAGTGPKSVPGFYFFDTRNQQNPQNGQGGQLTPDIDVKGGTMQAKGFIYVNSVSFGSQGLGGVNEWVNMPGEPFRDVGVVWVEEDPTEPDYKGFERTDKVTPGPACDPDVGTDCVIRGVGDGLFTFQDLAWSNTNGGKNNVFDFKVVMDAAAVRAGGVAIPDDDSWFIVPYAVGCNPGVNCSEPHEPYLNLVYPASPTGNVIAAWYDPALTAANLAGGANVTTRRPKITSGGNPVNCVAESGVAVADYKADRENCTSNGYDLDGGLVQLNNSFNGVVYTEGELWATGGAVYFGSVLAEGNAQKAGQPDIYFDERLVKGAWPPGNFGFPRVYITSQQTDQ